MRFAIFLPLTLAAGLAALSVGCSKTPQATTPTADVQKPTPADMTTGNNGGAGKVGRNPVKID